MVFIVTIVFDSIFEFKDLGTVSIKIVPVPKFYYILNEILQPYVGFRTVLFPSLSLPIFLSLMVKLCVILAKY